MIKFFYQTTTRKVYKRRRDDDFSRMVNKIIRLDRRTSNKSNVLHTNTIINYNEPFNHNVINVVKKATIIGQRIDFVIVSK